MKALAADFYERPVLEVARDLIGCVVEYGDGAGVIVETEAYHQSEPACHAFVGLTPRTRTLFGPAGRAYLYSSYGIHVLLNAVCERPGIGAAVLIRALEPVAGLTTMRIRRQRARSSPVQVARATELCSGPGKLTQALGIGLEMNGSDLTTGAVRITPCRSGCEPVILTAPRIGITKAIDLPWRFCAAGNPNVSKPWPQPPR